MAGERRLNWGADPTDATYRTGHDIGNSKFKIVEDLDGNIVLLEWDETAGEFVYRGPVNLNGEDITDSGTTVYDASTDTVGDGTTSADHQLVSTKSLIINQEIQGVSLTSGFAQKFAGPTIVSPSTATAIFSQDNELSRVTVYGEDADVDPRNFLDVVIYNSDLGEMSKIESDSFGGANSRSYSLSGDDLEVTISSGDGDYEVVALGLEMDV